MVSELISGKIKKFRRNARRWWGVLSETWQPGYSWEYREYRFREAFGILPKEENDQ